MQLTKQHLKIGFKYRILYSDQEHEIYKIHWPILYVRTTENDKVIKYKTTLEHLNKIFINYDIQSND